MKQEPPGGETFKSKNAQEREPPVRGGQYPTFWGKRIPTSTPEATKETSNQEQRAQGGPNKDKGQGDERNPDDNRRKPRDPKDIDLRKLFMGNRNVDTNRAVMQRYLEKFGEVEQVTCSNKYEGHGFVIFKAAAAVDEVQRARPYRIQEQAVQTRRDMQDEEIKKENKNLRLSRVQEPWNGPQKDTLNFDLQDYFGK